jgi:hypothetical protein
MASFQKIVMFLGDVYNKIFTVYGAKINMEVPTFIG